MTRLYHLPQVVCYKVPHPCSVNLYGVVYILIAVHLVHLLWSVVCCTTIYESLYTLPHTVAVLLEVDMVSHTPSANQNSRILQSGRDGFVHGQIQ